MDEILIANYFFFFKIGCPGAWRGQVQLRGGVGKQTCLWTALSSGWPSWWAKWCCCCCCWRSSTFLLLTGPPSPLTATSSLSCKSRRKLPPTPHSLPTHSPEVSTMINKRTRITRTRVVMEVVSMRFSTTQTGQTEGPHWDGGELWHHCVMAIIASVQIFHCSNLGNIGPSSKSSAKIKF